MKILELDNISSTYFSKSGETKALENISFSRAETIPIHFKVDVVLKENFALSQVVAGIKNGIIDNFNLNMGEKVIANDFIEYINDEEGVDYISDILVNQDGGDTWYKVNELDINQIAQVLAENIEIVEVE